MIRRHRQLARALVFVILTGIACGRGAEVTDDDQSTAPPPPPPVNVAVARVTSEQLTERVELSGRLEPWVEVQVSSELGGMVEQIGFDKGALVTEGQVLAQVGTDLYAAALAEAEALLSGAESTYKRATALVERQAVPRQTSIDAASVYEAAQARVAQSRLRLERSTVRAPVSGVAISRDVEPGEVLSPGTLITTIHRLDRVKAVVGIPENDIGLFRTGGTATLTVDAWPDRTFEGRIAFIAPSSVGSTRTFESEIALPNSDGALRPGMIGNVSLVRRVVEGAVVVSRDALQERDAGTVAIVLDGETARVRPVTLGGTEGDRVLIEDGLESGEWLIVSGQRNLIDGQTVHVTERLE